MTPEISQTRGVSMLDLGAETHLFAEEVRSAVLDVLDGGQYVNGPAVGELERQVSRKLGVDHAVAVSSGTDALLCALMAAGIGPGDEVIVPSFTFFATAGCVARVGATPVFVDVDARSLNIDPRCVRDALTPRTRAVIPVHLFGQCAEMDELTALAEEHGLVLIEDAAQAIGATYRGAPAGGLGRAGCLSFYPTKNLGGFGEGGMILTRDERFADRCRQLRTHGQSGPYEHEHIGGNFRLDTIQAAILLVKLRFLDDFTTRRRRNARRYDDALAGVAVQCPGVPDTDACVYHQYTIFCDRRDDLRAFLARRRIATGVYYPLPLHRQPCFRRFVSDPPPACPNADAAVKRVLSLPIHPMLSPEDVDTVAAGIKAFYASDGGDED